jgi:hypothetical protein
MGKRGEVVPLAALARLEARHGPTLIERDQLRRVISILGYYRLGSPGSMDLAMDTMMVGQMWRTRSRRATAWRCAAT